MKLKISILSIIYPLLLSTSPVYAGFEFCPENSGGEGGSGSFEQQIPYYGIVEVGELPAGISGVEIKLNANVDIDVQLYDKETGEKIVGWPDGILPGAGYQSLVYHGTKIEWSGYAGDGSGFGNEYIKFYGASEPSSATSRAYIMKAFGYNNGSAKVSFSWDGANCDNSAGGNGSFQQAIVKDTIVKIGDIPPGVEDLNIQLSSPVDVDVQLYDSETGVAIVAWPSGKLNGGALQSITYRGMDIEWSGYNGDGTNLGNEYIKITGKTSIQLEMKAFGYKAGQATVNYSWGDNGNTDNGGDNGDGNNDNGGGSTGNSIEDEVKAEIISLINQARSQGRNCGGTYYPATGPVTWNSKLYQAAVGHSEDMASNNYFAHTNLNGQSAGARITAAGYSWRTYGENIAAGYFSAQSVMQGWLNSPGHCKNIMKSTVTNVGVGKATGGSYGLYWTQVFAKPL